MNDREIEKFVKKDNVWKKPDYQAMLDSGTPLGVVYFIKKIRDSLNASPNYNYADNTPEKRLARQKEYIETLHELQAVMEDVHTVEDAMQAYRRFLIDGGYAQRIEGGIGGTRYMATKQGQDNSVVSSKLVQTLYIRSKDHFERNFTQKAVKDQFGVSKEQKVPTGMSIRFYDGNGYSRDNDWKKDTYYITRGYSILQTNFESREAALKWAQEYAKSRSKSGKQRFVPRQLEHITRTGPDFRVGNEITGQHYLDTFGFRGGEFGNWLNQSDRQASLNMGFEALKDLALALNISDKDISYQGVLAIAFGSRGSGNAAAHYEPLRKVINLTKMHGAGSLAHEWWHGLDDYLGAKMGVTGMLSEKPNAYPLFQKLVDTMRFKPKTAEQAAVRTAQQNERIRKNAERTVDSAVQYYITRYGDDSAKEKYTALKASFLNGDPDSVNQISAFKKSLNGHVIPKSEREQLEMFERTLRLIREQPEPTAGRTVTEYLSNSRKMGRDYEKDGGYWDSNTEMTARAFACYIMDKLPYQSDYLVGHAESAVNFTTGENGDLEILQAYPMGEERQAINAVFDEIVADLKLQHILTHENVIQPLHTKSAEIEQLSLFSEDKPSVISQLAAAQSVGKKQPSQTVSKKSEHEI